MGSNPIAIVVFLLIFIIKNIIIIRRYSLIGKIMVFKIVVVGSIPTTFGALMAQW
jgi:hypothetical protein